MRVLHIITNLEIGGAQSILFSILSELHKRGFEQQVFYFFDGPFRQKIEDVGISCVQITGLVSPYDPFAWYRLYTQIKNSTFDCVHAVLWLAGIYARILCRLLNIYCVTGLHNNFLINGSVRKYIDLLVTRNNDRMIAAGKHVYESARTYYFPRMPTITVVPNGVDWQSFFQRQRKAPITRQMLGLSPEHFVVGAVGRIDPIKRYEFILQSFKIVTEKIDHARLVILGGNGNPQYIFDLLDDLDIDKRFVVVKTNADAAGYYSLFDCLIHGCELELMPLAVLEAMASRVPCIVVNNTLYHEAVRNNVNGYIVNVGDTRACAENIVKFNDKKLKECFGEHAFNHVANTFNSTVMIDSYINIFKKK